MMRPDCDSDDGKMEPEELDKVGMAQEPEGENGNSKHRLSSGVAFSTDYLTLAVTKG